MLTLIVGIAASMILFETAHSWERGAIRRTFNSLAADRCLAIDNTVRETAKLLGIMDNIFLISPAPASPGFADYVQSLHLFLEKDFARHADLNGLTWAPKVSRDAKADFEKAAQRTFAPEFRIDESQPTESDLYLCYLCVGNTSLRDQLGNNLAADQDAWKIMREARDEGKALASAPLAMLGQAETRLGYRIFQPLSNNPEAQTAESRRQNNVGFMCLDLDVGALIDAALKEITPVGITIETIDQSTRPAVPVDCHVTRMQSSSGDDDPSDQPELLAAERPIDFFGRKLLLRCTSTPSFWKCRTIWQPWVLLAGGVIITLLATVHQVAQVFRARNVDRIIASRLAAIQQEAGRK